MVASVRVVSEATAAGPTTAPEPVDVPARIRAVLALDPDARALHFEGRWRSWRTYQEAADALDDLLSPLGFGPATPVGVVIRNRPDVLRVVVGLLATNRCVVTLSSAVPPGSLADEVERLRLPVVVGGPVDAGQPDLRRAVGASGGLLLEAHDDPEAPLTTLVPLGAEPPGGRAGPAPGVAVQMLTSGTTGPPKRVDLRYDSIGAEMASVRHYVRSPESAAAVRLSTGVAIVWNPVLHLSGLRGLVQAVLEGRAVALLERFDVAAWAAIVREHAPKAVNLVPSAVRMVVDADLPRDTFAGVKACFVGTAPLDPGLAATFRERYGVPILVVYGATEFAGGVTGWTLRDWERYGGAKEGSVGRANPGIELRIVDVDSGAPVPHGTVGLLEVRGPQLATPAWVRTTDLGVLDDDGFLYLRGRSDDAVIRGGFKVSTGVVRDALLAHPSVRDAGVVGMPDERLGEVPVAAVELADGAEPVGEGALLAYLRGVLAPYQVPARLAVVDELPRTPSMKVSQPGVRALFEAPPAAEAP
jgi:acyl-CoA synthetase (AMP-forming)/AMP-acid ligase II